MTTLDNLKAAIDHLDEMTVNVRHFKAQRKVCTAKYAAAIDFQLGQSREAVKQDKRIIAAYAQQLLRED